MTRCPRCDGLLVWDWLTGDLPMPCRAGRCLNCGNIVNDAIITNRASARARVGKQLDYLELYDGRGRKTGPHKGYRRGGYSLKLKGAA